MSNIANLFKPAHDHMLANTRAAKQILADLGAMPVERSSFNDDDSYEYVTDTLQLVHVHSHYCRDIKHPANHTVAKGMRAKHLGLWQYEGATA